MARTVPAAALCLLWTVCALLAQPAAHQRMLDALRAVADRTDDANRYLGDAAARRARLTLDALAPSADRREYWDATMQLAEEELRLGREAEAIRLFSEALALIPVTPATDSSLTYTQYRLAVAFLRAAETQNCARHPNPDRCIVPLRGDGLHREQGPSRQAIRQLTEVLERTPVPRTENLYEEATRLHLAARWLLSIAYMTVGGYPDDVPNAYRLPADTFRPTDRIPRFTNIAPGLGLDVFDLSGGAVADDFDGDGYLDIVVSTSDTRGQMRFFRNNRDGTFSDRTEEAGLTGLLGGLNLIQGDYDNDGNVDLLVLRGGWFREQGRHPNSLLRNSGDGSFTDVTFEAGLGDVHYPTQTASWADYDNDGDLDLYIGNESSSSILAPSQLFRNNGDGTFTDVAAAAGVLNHAYAKAVIWGDYDGDRWMDLYVSNSKGPNRLYRNNGNGTFTNVARALGVERPIESFPAWFWDVDNDGVLDLYVSSYIADIDDLAASALGLSVDVEPSRLYRGTGNGRFDEVAGQYGLTSPTAAMGSNFGDLDNDGFLDFYLGTGYPPYHSLMPGVMYLNEGGTAFTDVTYAGGFGHLQKGHGVVFADLDHDGDQDVYEQMGGAYPGDRFGNVLYENPGFENHWVAVTLVGVRSNRSAIGARVRVELVVDGARRSIFKHVNSGGSFGANPLRQTIGLGRATRIDRLEVFWPTTGVTQAFSDVPVDRIIQIVEDEPVYDMIDQPALVLGGQS